MRKPRIFQPVPLITGQRLQLAKDAAHHVFNVLRMKPGQELILFNGKGGYFEAIIEQVGKRGVEMSIGEFYSVEVESPLHLTLVQGISRGSRMDMVLQKAVEIGVNRLVPVYTEFTSVRQDNEKQQKRLQHWQRVVIAACEQCERNRLPELDPPQTLADWLAQDSSVLKLVLHPAAETSLGEIRDQPRQVILLAGPEGGFSDGEYDLAITRGYTGIRMGPRILRTETAALAALTACQTLWGDLR